MTDLAARDLIEGIEAWPFAHARGPGMALVLRLPHHGERAGSVPFPLVLVEDLATGCPVAGKVDPRCLDGRGMGAGGIDQAALMELVRTWQDGDEAWRLLMEAARSGGTPKVRRREAVARIAKVVARALPSAGFSDGFLSALRCMRPWRRVPFPYPFAIFGAGGAAREARAFCEANPLLGQIALPLVTDRARAGRRGPEGLVPGLSPARLARLRHPLWSRRGQAKAVATLAEAIEDEGSPHPFLRFVDGLPPEWLPGDRKGMRGFAGAYALARRLLPLVEDPRTLTRSCGGDWDAFLGRCVAGAPQVAPYAYFGVSAAEAYLGDPLCDFANRVVAPVVAAAGHAVEPVLGAADRQFEGGRSEAALPEVVACRILYRDRALPGCAEAARRWHEGLPAIQAGMPSLGGEGGWPGLFAETAYGDVVLRPLTSPEEVREEGAPGPDRNGVPGLSHCVSTYVPSARGGTTHIVSLRRRLAGGSYLRLATGEVHQDAEGRLRLVQLNGWKNAVAPVEAVAAMRRFLREHPALPYLEPRPVETGERLVDACGYDWRDAGARRKASLAYAALLPRGLREDPDALARAILAAWDAASARASRA